MSTEPRKRDILRDVVKRMGPGKRYHEYWAEYCKQPGVNGSLETKPSGHGIKTAIIEAFGYEVFRQHSTREKNKLAKAKSKVKLKTKRSSKARAQEVQQLTLQEVGSNVPDVVGIDTIYIGDNARYQLAVVRDAAVKVGSFKRFLEIVEILRDLQV